MSFENPSCTLIVTNASIKNNITTSITHIYIYNRPIVKTVYYIMNITRTEAKLFAIRYGINQATNTHRISKIIVITDSIYAARKIFNTSYYSFQIHVAYILKELRNFFIQNHNN